MSVYVGRKRRSRLKVKTATPAKEPMELLGFEGSRHMIPQRLPSARKEKTVGIRVIDLNTTAIENIKDTADTLKRLDLSTLCLAKLNEEFIGSLLALERLDVSNNKLDEDSFPNVFKKLEKLVELNVQKNNLTVLPPVVKRLKELRRLKLGNNKLSSTEGIEKLKKLQILLLDSNYIESLPRDLYMNLKRLEIFHAANNRIKEIHVEIRFLRFLTDVNVSGNKLTSLPSELLLLPRLEVLNASGNHISRIPSINVKGKMSHKLAHIDLSDNVLIKFPEHLLSMTDKLDICKNKIKSIPGSMLKKLDLSCGQELLIYDNPLINPPPDICDCGIRSIVQFFQEAKAEMKVYQGIKALVVGAPGSGKTSLVQTLVDQQSRLTAQAESTIGVDMYDLDIDIEDEEPADDIKVEDIHNANETDEDEKENRPKKEKINIPKTLQVSLWDFSGHSHYLQSHTFFIHDPALVIMVFNMTEYTEAKMQELIGDWLNLIISRNHKITAIPVGTMADQVSPERGQEICDSVGHQIHQFLEKKHGFIKGEIKKIESMPSIPYVLSEQLKSYIRLLKAEVTIYDKVIPVSSAEYTGINSLFKSIETTALNKDLFPNVMRVIPSLWSEVENYVEDKAWSTSIPYMKWDDYCEEITKKFGMKHLMVPITRYLNDIGKVIWYSEHNRLKDFVFLRPSWLADIIKHIFRHNIADIDYTMEENFKHNGIALDKFNSITGSILNEGVMDKDYLKGAWAGLVPYDSTKAIVEVMVVLMEHFEIAYPVMKPGSNDHKVTFNSHQQGGSSGQRNISSAGSRHGGGQDRSDSRMSQASAVSQASVFEKEEWAVDGRQSVDVTEKTKTSKKKALKKEEQVPLPKISKIVVPFIRSAKTPQAFIDEYNIYKYKPCLIATYRFPWFLPAGLFEMVCVRTLKESHGCTLQYQWDGGMYAQFNGKPYRLFIEKKKHIEGNNCVKIEVRHEDTVEDSEVEHMWGVLLPLLKDVEDLLHKYTGSWIQRHMGCPNCGDILSFFGEWQTPKELQGQTSKKCSVCQQDISTSYLIQPKEKKRVEEFLLRKLKRDNEKRRASKNMDSIQEDITHLTPRNLQENYSVQQKQQQNESAEIKEKHFLPEIQDKPIISSSASPSASRMGVPKEERINITIGSADSSSSSRSQRRSPKSRSPQNKLCSPTQELMTSAQSDIISSTKMLKSTQKEHNTPSKEGKAACESNDNGYCGESGANRVQYLVRDHDEQRYILNH